MTRPFVAAVCLALLLTAAASEIARATTPSIEEVATVAEGHGLACDAPDDLGGGSAHLTCAREVNSEATNIDLSVTYNVVGDGEHASATVATYATPPPDWLVLAADVAKLFCEDSGGEVEAAVATDAARSELAGCTIQTGGDEFSRMVDVTAALAGPLVPTVDWTPGGVSTYDGTWTLTAYATDSEFDDPEFALGATVPGSITVDCTLSEDFCGFDAVRDGEAWWVGSLENVADGELRLVTESELANCENGQVARTAQEVTFGPAEAAATVEQITEPRTCADANGTLYATDTTWTFEGVLVEHVPAPASAPTDLAGYLASYGLDCVEVDAGSTCRLELTDGARLDATYDVATRFDDSGAVIAVDALVTSLDASMPSDAVSFLRGVAERAPLDNSADLVAWFDAAVAGDSNPYADGDWIATWTDEEVPPGRTLALTIARPDARPLPPPSAAPAPVPVSSPPAGEQPSFADSVPTVGEVSADPIVLLQSAGLAALLVFLMPFPSQIFNSTLETHEEEVRRWLRMDRLGAAARGIGAFWASWPGVALFTLLAATLYGFLDPAFGLDIGSVATFVGMLLGIVLVTAAFAVPAILAHRRHADRPSVKVVPISLLIGVGCVLLSRVTDFQPGYLYGLLIGLAFARELSAAEEGRATAIGAVLMLAVALLSWVALGALPDGTGFVVVVARTSLAALMVAGLEGVVFGLLPMRFLPGEPLYAWNRVLWAVLLAVGAFAFFHILINPASGYLSDTSRAPLFTVLGLLLGFSLVSVAFWAWFRFRGDPPADEEAVGT